MGGDSYINKSFQKGIKYLLYLSRKKQNKTKNPWVERRARQFGKASLS